MINKFIAHLQKAEKHLAFVDGKNQDAIPYKYFGKSWVRADKPIMELYATCIKSSELQFYPNKNYKSWILYGLNIIKGKKNKQSVKKLLGIRLTWGLTKPGNFPLLADIIYYRHPSIIMVYTREKIVVKAALTDWGKKCMNNE